MKFLVLLAESAAAEQEWDEASEEARQVYMDAHDAFSAAIQEHGEILGGEALAGRTAGTTLRHSGGQPVWTEGPYAESVEQLGGYYLVDVPDLDQLMKAAVLLPHSYAVEIRPTVTIE